MRVYHVINSEYGLEDIGLRRLKVARISLLNEPFKFLGVASKSQFVRSQYARLKAGWDKYVGILREIVSNNDPLLKCGPCRIAHMGRLCR